MRHPALFCGLYGDYSHRKSWRRTMSWSGDLPGDVAEPLSRDPDSLLAAGTVLQSKDRCTVIRLDHAAGPLVLSFHNWGGPWKTIRKSLVRSPSHKRFLDGIYLHSRGVRTPRPLAYVEHRVGPLRLRSCVVTKWIEGTSLYRMMRFEQPPEELMDELAQQMAELWQQLDDLRVTHNDMKTENFVVDFSGRIWLLDLEKMRIHGRVSAMRKLRPSTRPVFSTFAPGVAPAWPPSDFVPNY